MKNEDFMLQGCSLKKGKGQRRKSFIMITIVPIEESAKWDSIVKALTVTTSII